MVTHGQHRQRTALVTRGKRIQLCRFHLDAQNAVAGHLFVQIRAFGIEHIRGIDAADMGLGAFCFGSIHRGTQQGPIGARGVIHLAEDTGRGRGNCRRRHGNNHIANANVRLHSATRANPN